MYPDLVVYERDKLYEEVWAEPVVKFAEHYGVAGTALAKTCRKLDVSLPPRALGQDQGRQDAAPVFACAFFVLSFP